MSKAYTPDVASAQTGSSIKQPSVPGGMAPSVAPSPGKLVAKTIGITNVPRSMGSAKAPNPTHVYPVRTGGAGFTQHPNDGIQTQKGSSVPKMNPALQVGKF